MLNDKEKLIELLTDCGSVYPKADATYLIANGVTVREKGEWNCLEAEIGYYACTLCDHRILRAKCNYCPNCGADMRGEEYEID